MLVSDEYYQNVRKMSVIAIKGENTCCETSTVAAIKEKRLDTATAQLTQRNRILVWITHILESEFRNRLTFRLIKEKLFAILFSRPISNRFPARRSRMQTRTKRQAKNS